MNRAPSKSEGNASDMALDACVVRHISRDIKHRVRGINVHGGDTAPFRFSEFATRVAGAMNIERDNDDESAGVFKTVPSRWKALGARWAGKFHRVPSLSYLYGSMGDGQDAKPAKMARAKTKLATRTRGRREGLSTRVSTRRKRTSVSSRGEEEEEQGANSIE